jgi:hypothetical protein
MNYMKYNTCLGHDRASNDHRKSEKCTKGMVTRGPRVRTITRIVKTKASFNEGDDEKL